MSDQLKVSKGDLILIGLYVVSQSPAYINAKCRLSRIELLFYIFQEENKDKLFFEELEFEITDYGPMSEELIKTVFDLMQSGHIEITEIEDDDASSARMLFSGLNNYYALNEKRITKLTKLGTERAAKVIASLNSEQKQVVEGFEENFAGLSTGHLLEYAFDKYIKNREIS